MKASVYVALLILGGALANLAKEIFLANEYGTSHQMDLFRVAYSIPNFALLTIGTVLASIVSGYLADKASDSKRLDKGVLLLVQLFAVSVFVLGIATTYYQVVLLYPGFTQEYADLRASMLMCWCMFVLGSVIFSIRPLFNVNGYRLPAASIQLVRAVTFILSLYVLGRLAADWNASIRLSVAACLSSAGLICLYGYFYARHRGVFSLEGSIKKVPRNLMYLILAGVVYQIAYTGSRFVDRYYASRLESGFFSSLEYSYGLTTSLTGMLSSFMLIVLLPKLLMEKELASTLVRKDKAGYLFGLILVLSLGAVTAYYLGPIFVKILLFRGSFDVNSLTMTNVVFKYQAAAVGFAAMSIFFAHYLIAIGRKKSLVFIIVLKLVSKLLLMHFFIDTVGEKLFGMSFLLLETLFFVIFLCVFVFESRRLVYVDSSMRNA